MKYIQDESTNTLITYLLAFIFLSILIVKWDIYETRKCQENDEYRELLSKVRIRGAFIICLIGLYAILKELLER